MHLTDKLAHVGESIFSVMSDLARRHGAVNLSQGFPDFNPPDFLLEALERSIHDNHHQYAPMPGVPILRRRIAEKIKLLYGLDVDYEQEILITPGATYGIYAAINALVHPQDEVILFEPAYDSYAPSIHMASGQPVYYRLKPPHYAIDWNQVEQLISSRTRVILINTPHNPTGRILGPNDLAALQTLAIKYNLWVVSDEVYEHILFDGKRHESVLRYPQLYARSIVVFSFGKTYHNTGWKIGYVVAPPHLTELLRKIHQFLVFSVHTPSQYAFAEILTRSDHYLALPTFYQQKRDFFREGLQQTAFEILPCAGTYFQCVRFSSIRPDMSDLEFARWLTTTHKVACIPVSAFYHDGYDDQVVRFCFAKTPEVLSEALEKLKQL